MTMNNVNAAANGVRAGGGPAFAPSRASAPAATNDLFDRLAADPRFGLTRAEIDALVADRGAFAGAANARVEAVASQIATVGQASIRGWLYARPDPLIDDCPRLDGVGKVQRRP
jgi:hypothetical protein